MYIKYCERFDKFDYSVVHRHDVVPEKEAEKDSKDSPADHLFNDTDTGTDAGFPFQAWPNRSLFWVRKITRY